MLVFRKFILSLSFGAVDGAPWRFQITASSGLFAYVVANSVNLVGFYFDNRPIPDALNSASPPSAFDLKVSLAAPVLDRF